MKRFALGLTAALVVAFGVRAEGSLDGNWKLTTIGPAVESTVAIIKIGVPKSGKPDAAVVFSPKGSETSVTEIKVTDSAVHLKLRQTRKIQDRSFSQDLEFVGVIGKDPKQILGGYSTAGNGDRFQSRAKLSATDKSELETSELTVRSTIPEPMKKAQELGASVTRLMIQAQREKDADKKKEIQKEIAEARKKADEESPALYREVVEKHADSPAALDAALNLLRSAAKQKMTADEAAKLVVVVRKQSEPYGAQFMIVTLAPIAETLANQKGVESAALAAIEPAVSALNESCSVGLQSRVLTAYQTALSKNGKTSDAKLLEPRIAKLEKILDDEYLTKVPPFKPEAFSGRKDKAANQTVVMELFTGAQCPPCVAADVAFDALGKAYSHHDLILIQYHMHIPGPDPMVNPDTIARWDYYKGLTGTPSTIFNGKTENLRGGGPMGMSESKFKQYRDVIDPLLEKSTPITIAGKANRSGDKISISVDVKRESASDNLKLRLLVVEDVVKFVGGNSLRFHHHVVRGMPGGAAGVELKGTEFHHSATADITDIRSGLDSYLTKFAEDKPFPQPGRPLEMKNLKVIALVQNDETREIVQAAEFEIEGQSSSGTGGR
jgi:hypothetical protein